MNKLIIILKNYNKEPSSFLVPIWLYRQIIHKDFEKNIEKTVSEKIRTVDNKTEQDKAQYNWDRETAKMFALSWGNVGKHKFLTIEDKNDY